MKNFVEDFIKTCAKAPIKFYTLLISPVLMSRCRFEPTCSSYTLQAIDKHGALKGLFLGMRRIFKCHPFSKCNHYDPVPLKFDWSIDLTALIRYKRGVRKK
ncbi:MAG: membrane protein insertion efficiency factor YidD [Alphaproteobacteria bacterium]|nr:membrane protein insertion efficiency factor YidD [Alphaproteobacteria bacterium]